MCCRLFQALVQSMHASHARVKALDSALHWQPSNDSLDFMVSVAESASGDNSLHMQTIL